MCDSTEEARQLSLGQGGERHKVATLEGTLFTKAGTITGGMAGNLLGRSQRWGDKEYETLKKVCYDACYQAERSWSNVSCAVLIRRSDVGCCRISFAELALGASLGTWQIWMMTQEC